MDEAISFNPLNPEWRRDLGFALYDLECYEEAKKAWEDTLYLDPDQPIDRFNIGVTYYNQLSYLGKSELRSKALENVTRYFEDALELIGFKELTNRAKIHYWLGKIYVMRKRYDEAIKNYQAAGILMDTADTQAEGLTVRWRTGQAYASAKRYVEAEKQFDLVIKDANKLLPKDICRDCSSKLMDGNLSRGYVLIMSHLDLAFAYTDQPTVPVKALELAKESNTHIGDLEKRKKEIKAREDDEITKCRSKYEALLGVIAHKQSITEIDLKP